MFPFSVNFFLQNDLMLLKICVTLTHNIRNVRTHVRFNVVETYCPPLTFLCFSSFGHDTQLTEVCGK